MKKSEILKLLRYLQTYYMKKFDLPEDANKLDMTVNTWYNFLQDYPFDVAKIATNKLITRKEWPPTPGEIAQEIKKIRQPSEDKLTAGEAWNKVLSAIRKYGVLYGTVKAEAELPRKVLMACKAVGGLRIIGMSNENDSYYMNQFQKAYREISEQIDETEMLPDNIQRNTLKLQGGIE